MNGQADEQNDKNAERYTHMRAHAYMPTHTHAHVQSQWFYKENLSKSTEAVARPQPVALPASGDTLWAKIDKDEKTNPVAGKVHSPFLL